MALKAMSIRQTAIWNSRFWLVFTNTAATTRLMLRRGMIIIPMAETPTNGGALPALTTTAGKYRLGVYGEYFLGGTGSNDIDYDYAAGLRAKVLF